MRYVEQRRPHLLRFVGASASASPSPPSDDPEDRRPGVTSPPTEKTGGCMTTPDGDTLLEADDDGISVGVDGGVMGGSRRSSIGL